MMYQSRVQKMDSGLAVQLKNKNIPMVKTTMLALLAILSLTVYGQQPFQGKIVYQVKGGDVSDKEGKLIFHYSRDKVIGLSELMGGENQEQNESSMLIDIPAKMSYEILHKRRWIKAKSLIPGPNNMEDGIIANLIKQDTGKTMIAGVPATLWLSKTGAEGADTSDLLSSQTIVRIWYADNLDFPIGDLKTGTFPLAMFSNGKVCLGLKISVGFKGTEMGTAIMASSVSPGPQPDSLFVIPEGYEMKKILDDVEGGADDPAVIGVDTTIAAAVDTFAVSPPPPPPPPAKKVPSKKKPVAKPKPALRKQ